MVSPRIGALVILISLVALVHGQVDFSTPENGPPGPSESCTHPASTPYPQTTSVAQPIPPPPPTSLPYCTRGGEPLYGRDDSGPPLATFPCCASEGPCYTSYSDSTSYIETSVLPSTSGSNIPTYTSNTSSQAPLPTTTGPVSVTSDGESSPDKQCTKIPANPDISGIGVRVSFYLLVCIISVIPRSRKTEPLLHSLRSILGLGGFAILLASIIETSKGRLSLYHAMIINSLLYFYWITLIASRSFSYLFGDHKSGGSIKFVILTAISMIFMSGWLLAVWKNPRTFGPGAECNDSLRTFVFGWRSPTGTAFRGFMISLAVFLLIFALIAIVCLIWMLNGRSDKEESAEERDTKELDGFLGFYIRHMSFFYLIPVFVGIGLIEAYIKKNRHLVEAGEDKWTFGQVVALVTVFGAINEVFNHWMFGSHGSDAQGGNRGLVEKA